MLTVDAKQIDSASASIEGTLKSLQLAQISWAKTSLSDRLTVIKRFRHLLAVEARQVAELVDLPQRQAISETLASEVIPLADAGKFLERNAVRTLSPQPARRGDRPGWGRGLKAVMHREPLGVVLIIGTWNYPLFLTGVQTLQALVAGNAAMIKPGAGTSQVTLKFVEMLRQCGIPADLLHVLPEEPGQAQQAMAVGVSKVVFTGSATTGKRVLAQLAETATPSVMELSGSDAVFVLPGAKLDRVAKCLQFGLRFNSSSTCIAPRRVFVPAAQIEDLLGRLLNLVPQGMTTAVHPKAGRLASELVADAVRDGAELLAPPRWAKWEHGTAFPATILKFASADHELLRSDIFAPVISLIQVKDEEEALSLDAACPYALGATVFGPEKNASKFAERVEAGCVVINDIIAPTADPRVPFGGRKSSGFGVTRGAEGLLEMTQMKTVVTQTSRWLPHLESLVPELDDVLLGFLQMSHGETWTEKLTAMRGLVRSGRAYRNAAKDCIERV